MNLTSIIPGFVILLCFFDPINAQSLDGEWMIKECTMAGKEVPADLIEQMSLKISSSSFEAKSGETSSSGKLSNDAGESPSRLTFQIEEGVDIGREIKSIYQIVDGKLQIAFSRSAEFPADFQSTQENQCALMIYKSAAPKQARKSRSGGRMSIAERRKMLAGKLKATQGGTSQVK